MSTLWIVLVVTVLTVMTSNTAVPHSSSPQRHELWQTGRSLVASIHVASLTSVFSPAVCLSRCLEEDCTLMTLAVTSSSSGQKLDCHLTNVTDWLNNEEIYLEECSISCNTFVVTRMPHLYFPLDGGNKLRNFGTFRSSDKHKAILRYSLGSQSGNPFTCTGPSGNPHVKYLLNNLDVNNYLITDLNEQWQPTAGFTLAIWVMFPGSPTVSPIFEFYNNDQLRIFENHLWFYNNPGQLYFFHFSIILAFAPVMSMTPGQWYHVAMTWRRGGELVFYWNATEIYRVANTTDSIAEFSPSYLVIGARAPNQLLRACLAHAIVHSEIMNQSQLQHLMMTQLALS